MTGMEFLVGCAWRGTVILAAAFAAAVILRRASAALRHLVWTAAFGALLMLPLALPFAPKWGVGPARVTVSVVGQAVSPVVAARQAKPPAPPEIDSAPRRPLILELWVFGCALSALRFLLGAGLAWWMLRRSTEAGYAAGRVASSAAELGITRRVRVIESAAAVMPMAWGVAHPVVILPAGAGAWPEPRLEAAVLHELVHIRRHDLAAQWLAQAACSLFWFHPLAWLGARQLRSAREQACDDAVLRRGIAPPDYAGRLLDLALTVASRPRTWTQAPAMAEMSDLETRVRALLDRGRNRQPLGRRAAAAVAAGGLAVLLAAAAITARAQAGNASLTGAVWDPSGAVIPGCEVAIKRADGSHQEVTRADGAGEFKFASVPPGSYGVEIRAPGFVTFKKDVKLAPAAAARLDAELVMGQVTETIVVTAPRLAPPLPAPRTPRRIRVGGNVQATRLIYHVKPVYPADSQQRGVEGAVVLRAVISIQGELLNLTPMSSEVDPELSRAALDAVRQWRYSPTLLNGQPVEVLTTIRVTFQLE